MHPPAPGQPKCLWLTATGTALRFGVHIIVHTQYNDAFLVHSLVRSILDGPAAAKAAGSFDVLRINLQTILNDHNSVMLAGERRFYAQIPLSLYLSLAVSVYLPDSVCCLSQ